WRGVPRWRPDRRPRRACAPPGRVHPPPTPTPLAQDDGEIHDTRDCAERKGRRPSGGGRPAAGGGPGPVVSTPGGGAAAAPPERSGGAAAPRAPGAGAEPVPAAQEPHLLLLPSPKSIPAIRTAAQMPSGMSGQNGRNCPLTMLVTVQMPIMMTAPPPQDRHSSSCPRQKDGRAGGAIAARSTGPSAETGAGAAPAAGGRS